LKEHVKPTSSDKDITEIVNSHSDVQAGNAPIPNEEELNAIFKDDSIQNIH
jgi:hypothetical protein